MDNEQGEVVQQLVQKPIDSLRRCSGGYTPNSTKLAKNLVLRP